MRDATTGELVLCIASSFHRLAKHCALFGITETDVICWKPSHPARTFRVDFAGWKLVKSIDRDIGFFRRDNECLIWLWGSATCVRTKLPVAKSIAIRLINGAVFIEANKDGEMFEIFIVPLMLDPLETEEEWSAREPPARLPDDAPFVPGRSLLQYSCLYEIVAPLCSDTHPPLVLTFTEDEVYSHVCRIAS